MARDIVAQRIAGAAAAPPLGQEPAARILVTGCYAQRAPQELARMPGVTWVVGNSHKHQAAEIATSPASGFVPLAQISGDRESNVVVGDIFAHTELLAAPAIAVRRQNLDGDGAVEAGVGGPIHLAHATLADESEETLDLVDSTSLVSASWIN